MKKVKRLTIIWTLTLFAAILTGCSESEDTFISKGPVNVDLNFTLSGTASHKTRMSDAVVQTDVARDYESFIIVPMNGTTPDIQSFSNEYVEDKTSSDPSAKFYHYGNCDMSVGDDGCIVYTKAQKQTATGVSSEAHNGSLSILYDGTPSESFPSITADEDYFSKLTFSPVSMLETSARQEDAQTDAEALATYLTNIANASVEVTEDTYYWRTYNNSILKILFDNFTNNVNHSSTGKVIAGSATNVKEWASQLKTALTNQTFDDNSIPDKLRTAIISIIDGTTISTDESYPRKYDLPDGAAVLQWIATKDGNPFNKFVPQTQTTTIANINTITRFAYPPELYYFVESGIRCLDFPIDYASLYQDNDTWAAFLTAAGFSDDQDRVTESTKAVALKDPVKYAVAHLNVTIQAGGATVKDANGDDITIGTDIFPLTGIIIGGQRAVDYKFEPTTDDDLHVKFLYDSQVKTKYDDGTDTYGYYYLKSDAPAAGEGPSTLVLQTNDEEDITIVLEFENQSGAQFYGVNNEVIYHGTRFYLVGTIPYSAGTGGDAISAGRVFTKAYTTVVNLTVNSLANAYNVLPNILSSHLKIGVELMNEWIAAQPTTTVLK